MTNDRKEREPQSLLFPVQRSMLNMAFVPSPPGCWAHWEAGFVLLHGHVSLSPCFSPVPALLQLPRFAKAARWKQLQPHTQSSWCALSPAQSGLRRQTEPKLFGIKDGRWGQRDEEQDGFGGQPQVSFCHWGTNPLEPKCLVFVWWEVQVELWNWESAVANWERGLALHLLPPVQLIIFQRQFYDVMQAGSQHSAANLVLSVLFSG